MQFWRELPKAEQAAALADAGRILSSLPTCAELQPDFPAEEFDRLCRLAQDQLAQKFDLPPQFPPRAREGLLGSLVLVAAEAPLGEHLHQRNSRYSPGLIEFTAATTSS